MARHWLFLLYMKLFFLLHKIEIFFFVPHSSSFSPSFWAPPGIEFYILTPIPSDSKPEFRAILPLFKFNSWFFICIFPLSGGVVVLPLTSQAQDWVFKPSLRQAVQATKLWLVEALIRASKVTRCIVGWGCASLCCSGIAAPKGPWPKRTRKGDRHLDH